MDLITVPPEFTCGIKSRLARFRCSWINVCARKWCQIQMIRPYMALKCLMFAKGLVTWWIGSTSETLVALM